MFVIISALGSSDRFSVYAASMLGDVGFEVKKQPGRLGVVPVLLSFVYD